MPYRAVLFDLDGTLLDTLEDLANAMNRVLIAQGFPPHPVDRYRYMVGEGAALLAQRAVPPSARDKKTIHSILEAYLADYAENWNVASRPYTGIMDMLEALAKRQFLLAVLSNKPDIFTNQCVGELLPGVHFEIVWGERNGIKRKPDPEGAKEIARFLGIPPSEFLYLGDTATDMQTAVSAGMFPVGVGWGFRPADELRKHGALVLLNHPLEILHLLDL